jgi:processing peptidase subunit alpha
MLARSLSKRLQTVASTSLRHFAEEAAPAKAKAKEAAAAAPKAAKAPKAEAPKAKPAAAAPASSALSTVSFNQVKFVKEDVGSVMAELPDFNFYEMNEPSLAYPYKGRTLDTSIVLDAQAPNLVAPKAEFSKLENGLKIASVDRQGMTASLGLFVSAGSRHETAGNFGVSHMVELMAYKSTAHLSHLRTVKTLEQLGAHHTATCKAGREETVYQVDVQREYVPLVVPLMIGNVLFPRLLPWEVKAAVSKVKTARAALESDPDAMVSELLHKAAYCNNTLGQSPLTSERSVPYFTPETIRSHMLDHFAPERMVLVGVNVAHSELSKWAMRSFADYNAIPLKDRSATKAAYTGGEARADGNSPYCHMAIGLESVAWDSGDLAAVTVLQAILGGGNAATTISSVGGGSLSRLSTEVVKQSPYVESCTAFNTSYSDSGLFGVYSVVAPDQAAATATAVTSCLKGLANVSADELKIAKAVLKGSILRGVDDSATLMKDLGTQLMMSGKYGSSGDFVKAIDGVTAAQVSAAAKKLLASKPTLVAFGDTHTVPHYSTIEAALK